MIFPQLACNITIPNTITASAANANSLIVNPITSVLGCAGVTVGNGTTLSEASGVSEISTVVVTIGVVCTVGVTVGVNVFVGVDVGVEVGVFVGVDVVNIKPGLIIPGIFCRSNGVGLGVGVFVANGNHAYAS